MTEHEVCIKCKWNHYPECNGIKIDDEYIKIDKLQKDFKCVIKDRDEVSETYITKPNPRDVKPTKEEIDTIKSRIEELEEKTSELSVEPISR